MVASDAAFVADMRAELRMAADQATEAGKLSTWPRIFPHPFAAVVPHPLVSQQQPLQSLLL